MSLLHYLWSVVHIVQVSVGLLPVGKGAQLHSPLKHPAHSE